MSGPIEEAYRGKMVALGEALDAVLNGPASGGDRKTGFVLLVFPFGDDGKRCNYISSAEREDIVVLLKEMTARFEGQSLTPGRA